MAPLDQFLGYFVAVWKGWKSIPLLLQPVSGLWPEVTGSPAGTLAWGRERRRWRNGCGEAEMMSLISLVSVTGPDNS